MTADELKAGLATRIRELCAEVLPGGKISGSHYCAGSIHGEAGQSLRVRLDPAHAGQWQDFASGEKGNALGLLKACLFAADRGYGRTLRWAAWWLGWSDLSPEQAEAVRADAAARRARAEAEAADRAARYRRQARGIWFGAALVRPGDPVWRYLAGRRIDLGYLGRAPGVLRYAAELYHGPTGSYQPGMVAAITDAAGAVIAVHRTYLAVRPDGAVIKDPSLGREAKMTLGRYREDGGMIRLWRGRRADGRPTRPWQDCGPGETAYVTEGIEDGLTLAMAVPEARIACAVSVSQLARIAWPAGIARVVVCRDADPPGSDADRQVSAAVRTWQAAGLRVGVVRPPGGRKDLNDYLQQGAA